MSERMEKSKDVKEERVEEMLKRFNKNEIIENLLENKKHLEEVKKTDVIKQAISILTKKFSSLEELILYLRLKYFEAETGKNKTRDWNVYEIKNAKRFSKAVQPDRVTDCLHRYFEKYDIPCRAYSENKGNCIWVVLCFGNTSPPKVAYLIAHTVLSVVFFSMKKTHPETEKILRKTFRGSEIIQLNSITENARNFSNLNFKSFKILQKMSPEKRTIPYKTEILPVKRALRKNRISIKPGVSSESKITEKTGVSPVKRALRKNRILEKPEVSPKSKIPEKTGVSPVKRALRKNKTSEKPEISSESKIPEKTGVSPVKRVRKNKTSEKPGISSEGTVPEKTVSPVKKALQKYRTSEKPGISTEENTIPEETRVSAIRALELKRMSGKPEVSSEERTISKKMQILPVKQKILEENKISKETLSAVQSRIPEKSEIAPVKKKTFEIYRTSKKAEAALMKSRIPVGTRVSPVQRRALSVAKKIKIKNRIPRKEEILQVKTKRYGKKSKISPETQLTCIEEITEENIESEKRKRKSSRENPENQNLPTIKCLEYCVKTSPFYKEKKDENDYSVCCVTFCGENVLKGLKDMTESGFADEPLPDFLYEKPRTGKTKFEIIFNDSK